MEKASYKSIQVLVNFTLLHAIGNADVIQGQQTASILHILFSSISLIFSAVTDSDRIP